MTISRLEYDKIRFFFEEDTFDAAGKLAKLKERLAAQQDSPLPARAEPQFASCWISPGRISEVSPAAVARDLNSSSDHPLPPEQVIMQAARDWRRGAPAPPG